MSLAAVFSLWPASDELCNLRQEVGKHGQSSAKKEDDEDATPVRDDVDVTVANLKDHKIMSFVSSRISHQRGL